MDTNGNNSHSLDSTGSRSCTTGKEDKTSSEKDVHGSVFINQAEIAWDKSRKVWIGDQSEKSQRRPREPVMCWTTTYEDQLSSNEPFHTRIPLAEMVDFLVDIWQEEGLYD